MASVSTPDEETPVQPTEDESSPPEDASPSTEDASPPAEDHPPTDDLPPPAKHARLDAEPRSVLTVLSVPEGLKWWREAFFAPPTQGLVVHRPFFEEVWPFCDNFWSKRNTNTVLSTGEVVQRYRCRLWRKQAVSSGQGLRNRKVAVAVECPATLKITFRGPTVILTGSSTLQHNHGMDHMDRKKRNSALRMIAASEKCKDDAAADVFHRLTDTDDKAFRQMIIDAGGAHLQRTDMHNARKIATKVRIRPLSEFPKDIQPPPPPPPAPPHANFHPVAVGAPFVYYPTQPPPPPLPHQHPPQHPQQYPQQHPQHRTPQHPRHHPPQHPPQHPPPPQQQHYAPPAPPAPPPPETGGERTTKHAMMDVLRQLQHRYEALERELKRSDTHPAYQNAVLDRWVDMFTKASDEIKAQTLHELRKDLLPLPPPPPQNAGEPKGQEGDSQQIPPLADILKRTTTAMEER